MANLRRVVVAAPALALALTALLSCGARGEQPARGAPVPVEVLELDAAAYGTVPVAALTTQPVQLRVFAGWFRRAERAGSEQDRIAPKPGHTLLAVANSTGCRLATGVEVRRAGDDLRVAFTGGEPHQACVRAYGPVALLSVPTFAVEGVRTVDGRPPVAATGPGRVTGFFPLARGGPLGAVEIGRGDSPAVLAAVLEENGDADAAAALIRLVTPGTRAFGFVLTGCRDTGAVLLVHHQWLDAEPTGGEGIACYLPEYYLVTFEVPADRVPERPVLGR